MRNRCQQCGYSFGSDVPEYILEKCWECRFKEEFGSHVSPTTQPPSSESGMDQ